MSKNIEEARASWAEAETDPERRFGTRSKCTFRV